MGVRGRGESRLMVVSVANWAIFGCVTVWHNEFTGKKKQLNTREKNNKINYSHPVIYPYTSMIPWHGYMVMCGYAKSSTVPVPTKPMTLNPWVFPYPWQTLLMAILNVHKHIFYALIDTLQDDGCTHSKNVILEEQLTIFLYTSWCVMGLSIWYVGEYFQWLTETVSWYIVNMSSNLIVNKVSNSYF